MEQKQNQADASTLSNETKLKTISPQKSKKSIHESTNERVNQEMTASKSMMCKEVGVNRSEISPTQNFTRTSQKTFSHNEAKIHGRYRDPGFSKTSLDITNLNQNQPQSLIIERLEEVANEQILTFSQANIIQTEEQKHALSEKNGHEDLPEEAKKIDCKIAVRDSKNMSETNNYASQVANNNDVSSLLSNNEKNNKTLGFSNPTLNDTHSIYPL